MAVFLERELLMLDPYLSFESIVYSSTSLFLACRLPICIENRGKSVYIFNVSKIFIPLEEHESEFPLIRAAQDQNSLLWSQVESDDLILSQLT